jgi:hypothetical protein
MQQKDPVGGEVKQMIRGSSLRSWLILIVTYRIKRLEFRPTEQFRDCGKRSKKLLKKRIVYKKDCEYNHYTLNSLCLYESTFIE